MIKENTNQGFTRTAYYIPMDCTLKSQSIVENNRQTYIHLKLYIDSNREALFVCLILDKK